MGFPNFAVSKLNDKSSLTHLASPKKGIKSGSGDSLYFQIGEVRFFPQTQIIKT